MFFSLEQGESYLKIDAEYRDSDTGLIYLRARWMNPTLGRFQSMDSDEGENDDPLSLHKYTFASGDPQDRIDPSGHDDIEGVMASEPLVLVPQDLPTSLNNDVTLYVRAFAPWKTFGGGFTGDNRSFSTSLDPSVTSRLSASIEFDVKTHTVVSFNAATIVSSYGSYSNTGTANLNAYKTSTGIHVDLSGSNAVMSGIAPPIAVHLDMGSSVSSNNKTYYYGGSLNGTAFPDVETFIYRGSKPTVLEDFATKGTRNMGPFKYLWFDNQPMGGFAVHD